MQQTKPAWHALIERQLEQFGVAALPAALWSRPREGDEEAFLESWEHLVQDPHMADGGRYRFRRYSRFLWRPNSQRLEPLAGTAIFQSVEDNPLNGGVVRQFEPLQAEILTSPFLHCLIRDHANCLPLHDREQWTVGVHCVRILARADEAGKPTPEGIHRDAERFTVQHLIRRHNIQGGVFSAYDEQKRPRFHWLQLHTWDTLFFTGTVWHGATPVESPGEGYRDILLIDFDY